MKNFICIFLVLVSTLGVAHSSEKELKIVLVLWRGLTDSEKGFQEGLIELGYSPQFTIIDARQNRSEFAGKLRRELMPRLSEFDYIYSFGTTASQMVKTLNNGMVPQIFNAVTFPVEAGIAKSIGSAGENISGVSNKISLPLQIEKALELRKISTLGFFFNSREQNSNVIRDKLGLTARKHKFDIVEFRVAPVENLLEKNLLWLEKKAGAIDAVYLPTDSYLLSNADLIGRRLKEAGIVSIGAQKEFISKGVLMGLVPDYYKLGKTAAKILDRHVKGENLKDIPVQFDTNPRIVINETTREFLKINIPETLLENAIFIE